MSSRIYGPLILLVGSLVQSALARDDSGDPGELAASFRARIVCGELDLRGALATVGSAAVLEALIVLFDDDAPLSDRTFIRIDGAPLEGFFLNVKSAALLGSTHLVSNQASVVPEVSVAPVALRTALAVFRLPTAERPPVLERLLSSNSWPDTLAAVLFLLRSPTPIDAEESEGPNTHRNGHLMTFEELPGVLLDVSGEVAFVRLVRAVRRRGPVPR